MSKQKSKEVVSDQPPSPTPSPAASTPPPAPKPVVYAFPTKARCPRCGSVDTRRRAEHGNTQYRECKAPICAKKFAVKGEAL